MQGGAAGPSQGHLGIQTRCKVNLFIARAETWLGTWIIKSKEGKMLRGSNCPGSKLGRDSLSRGPGAAAGFGFRLQDVREKPHGVGGGHCPIVGACPAPQREEPPRSPPLTGGHTGGDSSTVCPCSFR